MNEWVVANTKSQKGRSLEQMDYFFAKYQDRWLIGNVANEMVSREAVYSQHELRKVEKWRSRTPRVWYQGVVVGTGLV